MDRKERLEGLVLAWENAGVHWHDPTKDQPKAGRRPDQDYNQFQLVWKKATYEQRQKAVYAWGDSVKPNGLGANAFICAWQCAPLDYKLKRLVEAMEETS